MSYQGGKPVQNLVKDLGSKKWRPMPLYRVDGDDNLVVVNYGWNGTDWYPITIDAATDNIIAVTHGEHSIHEGEHYYVEGHTELDNTDEFYVKLITPDTAKWAHFKWEIVSNGVLTTEFYEGASGGMTGGTAVTPLNSDRNSNNTSGMTITKGVSAPTDTGTTISSVKVGGSTWKSVVGGSASPEDEIILKQNTTYCRKFLSGSDSSVVSFKAYWHEAVNKH